MKDLLVSNRNLSLYRNKVFRGLLIYQNKFGSALEYLERIHTVIDRAVNEYCSGTVILAT